MSARYDSGRCGIAWQRAPILLARSSTYLPVLLQYRIPVKPALILQQQQASTRASRGPVLLAVAYSPRAGGSGVGQDPAPSRPAAAAPGSLTAYLEVLFL
eukprot:SAG25_NODE_1056_length_4167_cov_3.576450_4_plen_100_part_00